MWKFKRCQVCVAQISTHSFSLFCLFKHTIALFFFLHTILSCMSSNKTSSPRLCLNPSGHLLLSTLTCHYHHTHTTLLFSSRNQWDVILLPAVSLPWFSSFLFPRLPSRQCVSLYSHSTMKSHTRGYIQYGYSKAFHSMALEYAGKLSQLHR